MTQTQKIYLFALRITLGWLFFWAGITKVINPDFSAAGYLQNAKTFAGFYHWLASPAILPVTNFLNEWGLTLLGVALILGIGTKWATRLGALLMVLYYLPILDFPYPNSHSFIVDEHIIYAIALLTLSALKADKIWGIDTIVERLQKNSR
jgi:thiosulfate dehydrogenase [quinone] large subunit